MLTEVFYFDETEQLGGVHLLHLLLRCFSPSVNLRLSPAWQSTDLKIVYINSEKNASQQVLMRICWDHLAHTVLTCFTVQLLTVFFLLSSFYLHDVRNHHIHHFPCSSVGKQTVIYTSGKIYVHYFNKWQKTFRVPNSFNLRDFKLLFAQLSVTRRGFRNYPKRQGFVWAYLHKIKQWFPFPHDTKLNRLLRNLVQSFMDTRGWLLMLQFELNANIANLE